MCGAADARLGDVDNRLREAPQRHARESLSLPSAGSHKNPSLTSPSLVPLPTERLRPLGDMSGNDAVNETETTSVYNVTGLKSGLAVHTL